MESLVRYILAEPIVAGGVQNLDEIQEEIKPAVEEANFQYNTDPTWGKTHQLSNIDKGWNTCVIKDYGMKALESQIYDACRILMNGQHFRYSMNSWITKYNEGDFAHIHNHNPGTYSGVYCYDVDATDGSHFYFDNGNIREAFPMSTGNLMVWKSHVPHGVLRHNNKKPRYTLSFNLVLFNEHLMR